MEQSLLALSSSVNESLKIVGPANPIDAAGLCQAVFKVHPEYAGHMTRSLHLDATPSKRKAQEWIDEVQTLFDARRIQEQSESNQKVDLANARSKGHELMTQARSEDEVQKTVDTSGDQSFAVRRAIREAAVERLVVMNVINGVTEARSIRAVQM